MRTQTMAPEAHRRLHKEDGGRSGLAPDERMELPNWMFDVDDEDDSPSTNRTLFQELEIDPTHIFK